VREELRAIYAAPHDPAFWTRLEAGIAARWRDVVPPRPEEWWTVLASSGRARAAGVVAATVAILATGALALQLRAAQVQAAYETVLEPASPAPLQAALRPAGAGGREATFRYVISTSEER